MKKVFRFGLVLISLLTLFSCNPFSVDDDDDYAISAGQESSPVTTELQNNAETGSQNLQPQKAFIKVVFNDGSSRTVLPSLYLKNFVLTGKRNGGAEQELAKAATKSDWSGKSIEILTGNWEFTMSAEVADGSTVVDGVRFSRTLRPFLLVLEQTCFLLCLSLSNQTEQRSQAASFQSRSVWIQKQRLTRPELF